MSRETAKQKSATGRFTQAMMTGARILAGADVPAYTLTYLSNSSTKRVGDYETIVIPSVQLGRDGGCAVRFSHNEFPTVSGTHAAIERQAENVVVIKHLSTSNPTLVNGRPINKEWYLNNGDVIQLSMEGPKLRFNTSPTGTAKIGFTQKAKLVVEQAIKPYKAALSVLGLIFLVSTSCLAYYLAQTKKEFGEYVNLNEKQKGDLNAKVVLNETKFNEAEDNHKKEVEKIKKEYTGRIASLQKEVSGIKNTVISGGANSNTGSITQTPPAAIPDEIKNQVYFLRVKNIHVELGNNSDDLQGGWTGTGFLLSDGRFVTARHCIQGWRFIKSVDEKAMVVLNLVENNGGRVLVDFEAVSTNGNTLNFQYDSKSRSGISVNDKSDKSESLGDGQIKLASLNENDWAVVTGYNQRGDKSYVQALPEFAAHPKAQIEVHILGFSYGDDLQDRIPKPLYSKSMIAQDELTNGVINVTDRNFGPGNSGGPVFVIDKSTNTYKVIGIVSAGIGSEIGIVVPISQIH